MKKLLTGTVFTFLFLAGALASTTPKGWLDSLDQAKKTAAETGRPILVLFTGSDWCPPCKALKKNVFEKSKFEKYAEKKVVLLYIDAPRKAKLAEELAEANKKVRSEYGVRSYPTVLLLDADGRNIGQIRERSLGTFMDNLKDAVEKHQKNREKAPAAAD